MYLRITFISSDSFCLEKIALMTAALSFFSHWLAFFRSEIFDFVWTTMTSVVFPLRVSRRITGMRVNRPFSSFFGSPHL